MKIVKTFFTILAFLWLIVSTFAMLPIELFLLMVLFKSKKHFIEWTIFLYALLISIGVFPIGFIYKTIKTDNFLSYLRKISLSIDISGNIIAGELLNDNFITQNSNHKFGVVHETISDNLGENERDNTLTNFGKRFTNLLSVIDFNHAQKSIVNEA